MNVINELSLESGIENITISLQTFVERRVRDAAVKITSPKREGHGSGTYFTYRGFHLVITAMHVIDEMDPKHIVIIGKDNESVEARLLYKDAQNDIAVLQTKGVLETRRALMLNIQESVPQAGDVLTYTGFPSNHDMLTFQGKIAGFEEIDRRNNRSAILIHTYGWFGSSGSCLFNERAQLVAILWGIDVEVFMVPQAQEDLVYASLANTIDLDAVLLRACKYAPEKPICQRIINRDILQRFGRN
jgi:S1-C subfamily serine protease